MAAGLFARKLQAEGAVDGWVVESAGTWALVDRRVPPDVRIAARMLGIDLRNHRTRPVDAPLLERFDLILVMERGHREALLIEFPAARRKVHLLSMLADRLEYDIADLGQSGLGADEVAAQLAAVIDRAYPTICRLAQALEAG